MPIWVGSPKFNVVISRLMGAGELLFVSGVGFCVLKSCGKRQQVSMAFEKN
jgi:hypothetical protein